MRRPTMPMPMCPTLPILDLVDMLARDYEAMDPSDARLAGLLHALRVLSQSYAEHPGYREEWRP
ncbi:DUF6221 family protein [Streptomyces sp. NPDC057748]|uniref:DUF6221 family protein n=1 Tax=unclassified Streptomyces TaxID=2593676 RepID=UPI0036BF3B16